MANNKSSVPTEPEHKVSILVSGVDIDGVIYYNEQELPEFLPEVVRQYVADYLDQLEKQS